MKDRFVIDTNILVYQFNSDSKYYEESREFMRKAKNRDAAIPVKCLSEAYSTLIKKGSKPQKAGKYIHSLKHSENFEIIETTVKSLNDALNVERNFWDRIIEATSLANDYKVIYTENTSDFKEIKAINPFK